MSSRLVIGIALMTAVINPTMADENSGKEAVRTEKTNAGVILEYKKESPARPDRVEVEEEDVAPAEAGTSVELIVGGQAEDGVAKRREIPIRK